ncbi:hypothetical protein JCM3775_006610 [Rhodotorula graminis]
MSTPDTPIGPVLEESHAAVVVPRPARVPDELVLMVVDWCDKLAKDRLKTLSALVRLAKRFKGDVERRLYSRVAISDELGEKHTLSRALREVLIRRPSVRRYVQAVELSSPLRYPWMGTRDDRLGPVLRDLPAVTDITCQSDSLGMVVAVLSNPAVQIRRLETPEDPLYIAPLFHDYGAAFATLQSLRVHPSDLVFWASDGGFGFGIKVLELTRLEAFNNVGIATSPFSNILTRLSLPVSASLATCDPPLYPSLKHLSLSSDDVGPHTFRQATSAVVTFLKAAATSANLLSFEWQCTIAPSDGSLPSVEPATTPAAPFPITNAILAAVPRQIRHLSLLTDCFAPADVAAYLADDAQRPPHLATLRIGGALGRGLGRILGGEGEVGGEGGEGSSAPASR